jgi:hypothetical protein
MSRYLNEAELHAARDKYIQHLEGQLEEARGLIRAMVICHDVLGKDKLDIPDVWLEKARKIGGGDG